MLRMTMVSWAVTAFYAYSTAQQTSEVAQILWGFGTICWFGSGLVYLHAYLKWGRNK